MTRARVRRRRRTDEPAHDDRLRPAPLRRGGVRDADGAARAARARCARAGYTEHGHPHAVSRSTGWRRRSGSSGRRSRPSFCAAAIAGGVRRLRDDVLHERGRLADQRRQPAAAQRRPPNIPITFELTVLLGGALVFFGFFALAGCRSPITRCSSRRTSARLLDAFFLSVELPAGDDARARASDVRTRWARRRCKSSRSRSDEPRAFCCAGARRWPPCSCADGVACDENILDPMADRQPQGEPLPARATSSRTAWRCRRRPRALSRASGSRSTPRYDRPRGRRTDPDERRAAARVREDGPVPVTRKLLALGRKRYDITCAHLPRAARRRRQHRRPPDVAAPAAVAAPYTRGRPATSTRSRPRASG